MPMTKEIARARISREMNELEALLNTTQAQAARLAGTISVARNDCAENRSLGLAELARLSRVQQHLTKASADTVRVHGGLHNIDRAVGFSDEDCPKATGLGTMLRAI